MSVRASLTWTEPDERCARQAVLQAQRRDLGQSCAGHPVTSQTPAVGTPVIPTTVQPRVPPGPLGRPHALGLVDAGRRRPADADTDLGPGESSGAKGDDLLAQLIGAGALAVDLPGGLDQRPCLVELEAVAVLTSDGEAQVLTAGGVAGEMAVANGAVEDLGEQVQVGVDGRRVLCEAGEAIEDEAAGNGNVEAGADADHRDLHAPVGGLDVLGGDALGLMAQQNHCRLSGGRQTGKRNRVVGQFDGDDLPAGLALKADPTVLAGGDPVDATAPRQTARVTDSQRLAVVRGVGDGDARAGCVTRAQQRAEVGLVGNPERSDEEVSPATVAAPPAGPL
jgi:hypothetical protein